MKITDNLHAFVWESMTANNCNSYLIDGPTRVLIDPGHSRLFDHVELGLKDLGLTISDIGRTDLPGGDSATLKQSVKRLADLDVEWLLSGHGDVLAGAEAVRKNFEDIEQFYFAYI